MTQRNPNTDAVLRAMRRASLVAVCLPLVGHTQVNGPDDQERVIVTATRIEKPLEQVPAAVTIVGQDAIQLNRQQLALDESLTRVPGVFMQARYNFARDVRVSIRGFGARANFGIRGVKIVVDGIPETLPDGQGGVDGIDLAATSQIEVLRGPSASLWGNASGGVINVTTERPPDDGFSEVRVSAGQDDFQKLQFKTGRQGDKLGYLVSVTDSEYDGWREHALMENTQLTGRFNVDLGGDRELISVLSYTDQPRSDDPGAVNAAQAAANPRAAFANNLLFNAGESQEKTRLGFVYNTPLAEGHSLQARTFIVDRTFNAILPTGNAGIIDLDSGFIGVGLTYSFESTLGSMPNTLMVGFDYEQQDDDRDRFNNSGGGVKSEWNFSQNESVESHGVYVQNDLGITDTVTFSAGVRFDEIEYDVSDFCFQIAACVDPDGDSSGVVSVDDVSPMLGVTVNANNRLTFYGTYSTAFEAPTTTEFAQPDGVSGGFNPNVNPQDARNLEVGVRGLVGDNVRYEVALFDIKGEDELVQTETPVADRFYFANAAESSRQGIEFSLSADLTDRLTTMVSLTLSDFKFDRFVDSDGNNYSGNRIPGTLEDYLFAEIVYRDPDGLFAAFDINLIGDQFAENGNTVLVDNYMLANLRLGYDFTNGSMRISPFVGITNLFDENYFGDIRINAAFGQRYFDPAPGRSAYAGVTVRFGR